MNLKNVAMCLILSCLLVLQGFVFAVPVSAKEKANTAKEGFPSFGGPDAVEVQLETDRAEKDVLYESKLFKPFYSWQAELKKEYGFSFGLDYSAVYLQASKSLPNTDDYAGGGMVRLYGSWDLLGRGTDTMGSLTFKVEHRHRYTATAPNGLSMGSLGNVGVISAPFSNQEARLTNLYWRQSWSKGRVVAVAGFLDSTDYLDVYALGSPWTGYLNFAFSTGAASISLPEDAALGMAAGVWLNNQVYMIAGLEDTNSEPDDPFKGFETFFNDHEYFKHIEIGWTTSRKRAYLDNIHLTLWHVDEREKAGVQDGWGAMLSFTHFIGDRWMPFLRAGYAKDGGSLLERSVSAGMAYRTVVRTEAPGNLLGFGVNWGQPNEAVFGPDLDDQYALELFYRLQVTKEIAVTPDVQLLLNPALNQEEDQVWVFGLRARLAF